MTTMIMTGKQRLIRRTALIRSLASLFLVVLSCLTPSALADGAKPGEYDIKAAFLYNFLKYVEFPAQAFPAGSSTLTVGVLGRDPFGDHIKSIINKSVQGRVLIVKRFNDLREVNDVNVLFVSSSEKARLKTIFDTIRNAPILTIGETGGFAKSGGIINFTIENNSIRFEVNPDAAERARLKISSQLLKLARVVKS